MYTLWQRFYGSLRLNDMRLFFLDTFALGRNVDWLDMFYNGDLIDQRTPSQVHPRRGWGLRSQMVLSYGALVEGCWDIPKGSARGLPHLE